MQRVISSRIMNPSNGTKIVRSISGVLPTSIRWDHLGVGRTPGIIMIHFGILIGIVDLVFTLAGVLGIVGTAGVTGILGQVGIPGVLVIHMAIPLIHPMDMAGVGAIIGFKTITTSHIPQIITKSVHSEITAHVQQG